MSRAAAVRHAIHEMELSGFVFTPAELETWDKIARGELPFEYVREEAAQHLAEMRKRFPENLMTMSQANNAWLFICREEFFCKKFEYQNHLSNETHPRTLSIAAHASNDNALSLLKT